MPISDGRLPLGLGGTHRPAHRPKGGGGGGYLTQRRLLTVELIEKAVAIDRHSSSYERSRHAPKQVVFKITSLRRWLQ